MKIFFYGGSAEKEEQRFAEKLLQRPCFANMVILPGGGELISQLSLELRGGDLLILCAASVESFESLMRIHKKFEDFRIILVLPRQDNELIRRSHQLRPRYITSLGDKLTDLDIVVEKMIISHANDRIAEGLKK